MAPSTTIVERAGKSSPLRVCGLSAGYSGANWSHGNWFCGFWVGLLLAAYLRTSDQRFLNLANERLLLVAPRATDGNTHDIGFIFYPSDAFR